MKLHTLYLSLLLAATTSAHAMEFSDAELARASALQKRLVTLDSHLDTPANLERGDFDVMQGHAGNRLSQVDYPRMLEGALDGGFWAVYTGQGNRSAAAHLDDRDAGLQRLMKIHNLLAAQPQRFALATTPTDAARIKAAGKRVVYISMENASPLVADPSLLRFYYAQGLRLMSTVHFLNNEFADSATDPKGAEWKGLSPAGKQLVQQAQALGIVIDQSHASDAVFDQLIALSPVPIVLSHSGARGLQPPAQHRRRTPEGAGRTRRGDPGEFVWRLSHRQRRQPRAQGRREGAGRPIRRLGASEDVRRHRPE